MSNPQPPDPAKRAAGPLLAAAALVAAAGALVLAFSNYRTLDRLADDATLQRGLADRLAADPDLRATLAASTEFRDAARHAITESLTADDDLQTAVIRAVANSPELAALMDQASASAVARFQAGDGFRSAVLAAMAEPAESGDLALPVIDDMQRALRAYEQQLTALAAEVRDDESAAAVNAMQGQLLQLQQNIDGLSDQVGCALQAQGRAPRTFLLKSNESTALPGYDLVISLSRLRDERIETVSVSAPEGAGTQVNTKVIGNVALGTPFRFEQGNTTFEGVFTFAQNRLFARALIGFEIRPVIPDGGPC